jgi:hypothetical protein
VEFRPTAAGSKTRLRMEESGLAGLDLAADAVAVRYRQSDAGWVRKLVELRDHRELQAV